MIFKPKYDEYRIKGNNIYFERNKLIAQQSTFLFAFPLNNSGGTLDTINWWKKLNKDKNKLIVDNING